MTESVLSESMAQMITVMTVNGKFRKATHKYLGIMTHFCCTLDRLDVTSSDRGAHNFLDDMVVMHNLIKKFEKIGVTEADGYV